MRIVPQAAKEDERVLRPVIKPLTSFRFVFAILVFASHLDFVRNASSEMMWLFDNVFYEGYIGVTFFFVLSGFKLEAIILIVLMITISYWYVDFQGV